MGFRASPGSRPLWTEVASCPCRVLTDATLIPQVPMAAVGAVTTQAPAAGATQPCGAGDAGAAHLRRQHSRARLRTASPCGFRRVRVVESARAVVRHISFNQPRGFHPTEHWHDHCCVSDGVFAAADGQTLAFMPATVHADRVAGVQARVRRRVLAAYCRHGVLDAQAAEGMARLGSRRWLLSGRIGRNRCR